MKTKKEKELYQIVYSYETKHDEGFTRDEMYLLCKELDVDVKNFSENLGVNTVKIIEGDYITYHTDVYYAMRKSLGYSFSPLEWD